MDKLKFSTLKLVNRGKVRDMYEFQDEMLVLVASDRISAFDVVLNEPIPNKGRVLTAMTVAWLNELSGVAPNHLVSTEIDEFLIDDRSIEEKNLIESLAGRTTLVKKAKMLPIECIVRGYISGSAWKEYSKNGTVHFTSVSPGLLESSQLPEPIFTPSTKADIGHDENISFEEAVNLIGLEAANRARDISLSAYEIGRKKAFEHGIIVADTKFELGYINGEMSICDEVLTPDSSRFWPKDQWIEGSTPPSFDKQPVRDWLESTGWDKTPPPPRLPDEVVTSTSRRYEEAYEKIFDKSLDEWPGV
ncbi:MAG: phosphoribosylaminoimidazolesuccinocarboxamide synthase [Acidimicrobiales bacterium]|nr:phosphoribosylaminoimidazolesuccinocarboxamide synthase [Acidimicrobiales bacterium]